MTAISLCSGSCRSSHRPKSRAASSRVWFSWRYSIRGAASKINAAATGASWLPSALPNFTLGRAKANASSAMIAALSSSKSKCRSFSRRRFASARFWMNRSAGNSSRVGFLRMIRCRMIGTATSALPARSER